MFKRLREDIEVVFEQDPAARGYFEVILTYSGLHAVWAHRIAHAFIKEIFFSCTFCFTSEPLFTGIEIHPGATIGRRFYRSWNGSCNWRNL